MQKPPVKGTDQPGTYESDEVNSHGTQSGFKIVATGELQYSNTCLEDNDTTEQIGALLEAVPLFDSLPDIFTTWSENPLHEPQNVLANFLPTINSAFHEPLGAALNDIETDKYGGASGKNRGLDRRFGNPKRRGPHGGDGVVAVSCPQDTNAGKASGLQYDTCLSTSNSQQASELDSDSENSAPDATRTIHGISSALSSDACVKAGQLRLACPYQAAEPGLNCLEQSARNREGGCAGFNRLK